MTPGDATPEAKPASPTRLQGLLDSIRSFKRLRPKAMRYWGEPVEDILRRWQKIRSPALPIEIRPYDPDWPALFERERQRVGAALGGVAVDIQHIGSTSIPGLASKNIIDFYVAINGPPTTEGPNTALADCGYESYGNSPIDPETDWLWRSASDNLAYVAHLCDHRRPWLATAVNFRDYLSAHPEQREIYVELKRRLAEEGAGFLKYTVDKMILWTELADQANAWRASR